MGDKVRTLTQTTGDGQKAFEPFATPGSVLGKANEGQDVQQKTKQTAGG